MDHETIYREQPERYDRLVAREDHQGNLGRALRSCLPPGPARIIDIGTGTGRVAELVWSEQRRVVACDRSLPMLRVAAGRRGEGRGPDIDWAQADNRRLPFESGRADLVVAGWSLGHSVGWYPETWRVEIGGAISEMRRLARPGGLLAVIETLGTGSETPLPPTQGLADYYQWLEAEHGFDRGWLRTDYLFESAEEAERLVRFFFGDALADRVRASGVGLVPECTGLWTRRVGGRA
jgi:ubiquinone/menaquinone biosynthesis C-methylase UbiE